MKKYLIHSTDLEHDGQRYFEGDTIELDDAEAARLIKWLNPLEQPLESFKPLEPQEPIEQPLKPPETLESEAPTKGTKR
ncbi:hypothetical protein [Iodobacter fluviatilis]|uniref:DUF7210 domain-containing protein n=1 Tax=Iodobacter fluviatilis TaxID=537 RepID=A0A377Q9A4_9NEIS|nr:hypothetical protein [Iodobacter fluviatilis]TCU88532.1 hypothetical protein EV682_103116 [Iodobacter fluviatilis]STQ91397.1 Uncharacterised protein [Iodobacter fluviatilis]